MFFLTFETKSSNRKAIWSMGGFPQLGRGVGEWKKLFGEARRVKKICTKGIILGTGVIWGRSGVILVILECRITVCNSTFCQTDQLCLNGCEMFWAVNILHFSHHYNKHLGQLDLSSFYESFDESRTVYLVYFWLLFSISFPFYLYLFFSCLLCIRWERGGMMEGASGNWQRPHRGICLARQRIGHEAEREK